MDKISILNLKIAGNHGVYDFEKERPGTFEIDVEISTQLNIGVDTDDIRKTVNYSDIYEYIVRLFSEKRYNLIETLANNISLEILNKFNVNKCKVIIRKPDAPINGVFDFVEVEVNKSVG